VQRDEQVLARRDPQGLGGPRLLDPRPHRDERVDHRVADVVDELVGTPLGDEVVARLGRVDEEQGGELVGDEAVELLGHRPVEAPQARLDVGDRDLQLGRRHGGRQRRVHVPGHEDHVGRPVDEDRLEALHHARGLLPVRARPDVEHEVRLADLELLEEDLRHRVVVVLAGVHQHLLELVGTPAELGHDRDGLHEVGARPDNRKHPAAV
jgi:hypothetical protein